jgi:hypothetical protein
LVLTTNLHKNETEIPQSTLPAAFDQHDVVVIVDVYEGPICVAKRHVPVLLAVVRTEIGHFPYAVRFAKALRLAERTARFPASLDDVLASLSDFNVALIAVSSNNVIGTTSETAEAEHQHHYRYCFSHGAICRRADPGLFEQCLNLSLLARLTGRQILSDESTASKTLGTL